MYRVIEKKELAPAVTRLTVEAPEIARAAQAGQFAAVVSDERGERIPLTLADWDPSAGTITLIFQKVGATTRALGRLEPGDTLAHVLGPLGRPTHIKNYGEVITIGAGVGIAEVYPVSRALKAAGNRVLGIAGARTAELVILRDELEKVCDEFLVSTDDGSLGRRGFVTDVLKDLFLTMEHSTHTKYPQLVYAIGPVPMMKAVAEVTRGCNVPTIVSLNPIMVDATGMCGACRCSVGGKTVFGCVDGPDFDAHEVDFDELLRRSRAFLDQEKSA